MEVFGITSLVSNEDELKNFFTFSRLQHQLASTNAGFVLPNPSRP